MPFGQCRKGQDRIPHLKGILANIKNSGGTITAPDTTKVLDDGDIVTLSDSLSILIKHGEGYYEPESAGGAWAVPLTLILRDDVGGAITEWQSDFPIRYGEGIEEEDNLTEQNFTICALCDDIPEIIEEIVTCGY